jgi:hypothetical protein
MYSSAVQLAKAWHSRFVVAVGSAEVKEVVSSHVVRALQTVFEVSVAAVTSY